MQQWKREAAPWFPLVNRLNVTRAINEVTGAHYKMHEIDDLPSDLIEVALELLRKDD